MNANLQPVPTIDELLHDPMKAATLPPDTARMLLAGLAGLLPVLVAQSSRESQKTDSPTAPERWITAEEASAQYGLKPRWFRDNKDKLPHSKPSHKTLLFPEQKLRSWMLAHKAH